MKHRIGIAAAVFAVLVGGGVALAEAGSQPPEDEVIEQPAPEDEVADDDADEADDDANEADDDADDADEADGAEATDNHGAVVSQAAHDCPRGPGGIHGACVSAVARDHDGDGIPDHGPGSDVDDTDDTDDADDTEDTDDADDTEDADEAPGGGNGQGQGNGGGRGNGRGNGRGR